MKKIVTAFVAVLLLIGILIINAAQATLPRPVIAEETTITTGDGLVLHAWFRPNPQDEQAPLMLLLPMRSHDHESYNLFLDSLNSRLGSKSSHPIPYVLAFDLRGHGKSINVGVKTLSYSSMGNNEYAKIPGDILDLAVKYLSDKSYNIDSANVIVIGASVGANAAIQLTEILPAAKTVVALSPGENYLSLEPKEAAAKFGGRMLIMVGQEDKYSASSSVQLVASNSKNIELEMFASGDHGTSIINNDPAAMTRLLDWLYK